MLNSEINSNRRQSFTFMETLQDKLKDIKNFSNWSAKEQMVAVTSVGVIFGALLPVVAVVLPVAAAGAAVALTLFFAVKAVEYGYKGLKWSAEKTWKGAKRIGRKVKDGAVYVKDKAKEGASTAADRLGDFLKNSAHSNDYSIESEFVQEVLKQKGIQEVVNDTIKIVKANDSSVLPAIKSAINSKIGELDNADKVSNLKEKGNLEKQRKIVDRLEEILTKSPLDTKELTLITEVFSQYQNEVKGILDDYKKHPEKYPKPLTLSQRMLSFLPSSFSSPKRKSPKQSDNSPSPVTDSTSSNSGSQEFATIASRVRRYNTAGNLTRVGILKKVSTIRDSLSDLRELKDTRKLSFSGSLPLSSGESMPDSRSVTASSSGEFMPDSRFITTNSSSKFTPTSRFSKQVDYKELKKKLKQLKKSFSTSLSDFSDSEINSDYSTLEEQSPPVKTLIEAFNRKQLTRREQPSSKVDDNIDVQHQTIPKTV